jgi:tol-pal system protein YbgF
MATSHHRNGQQEWIKNIILMRTSMKRAVLYSVVLLGLSILLVQCVATQQDVEYTNVKVREMDSKVDDINKDIEDLKKQTVQSVQARQAETGDRLDYQQSEILRLQGEIEENNFLMRQVQEENRELKKLLLTRMDSSEQSRSEEINRLNERLALTDEQLLKAMERVGYAESEIMAIKEARSQEASQRAMEAAQRAREAERKARMSAEQEVRKRPRQIEPDAYKIDVSSQNITESSPDEKEAGKVEPTIEVKTAAPPPPPPSPPAVANSYDQGMSLFKQKKYRDAYNSFAEYLVKNPSGSKAVDARYYGAESLYGDKDYELAILEYQKVIVEHSKHELAPRALYRQGLSFEKIGDPETARIVYNKLVDTYPKSEEVASAKTRLESLKR